MDTRAASADADERTQIFMPEAPPLRTGNALPTGHRLRQFRIDALLGEGGFGIVYRATDERLRRTVAIKEYMPASLAVRHADLSVSARSPRVQATFDKGLRSFMAEAQTLASLEHHGDALVEVHDVWDDNGTAYMVMRCYSGPTLQAWREQQPEAPDEAWLQALLAPLLNVLERLHAGQPPCYHRDIAPDNILLLGPGRPLLLDFGAARRVIGDATQDLSVTFKPGYTPVEQYGESSSLKQGPWTDVYALCAAVYFAITGEAPLPSVNRLDGDALVPLAQRAAGRCSERLLAGIDAGLRVHPRDRPQDMAALRRLLLPAAPAQPAGRTRGAPGRRGIALGGVAALALAGIGTLAWRLTQKAAPEPAPVKPAPPPPKPLPPAPPAAFDLFAALEDIARRADPSRAVRLQPEKQRMLISKDALRYTITSAVAGHVYVYQASTGGQLVLMFPNDENRDNRIQAGRPLELPRKGETPLIAQGPPGTDLLLAVVWPQPRDLYEAGLPVVHEGLAEFDLAGAREAWRKQPGSGAHLLGGCARTTPCDATYGAALVRLEEVKG